MAILMCMIAGASGLDDYLRANSGNSSQGLIAILSGDRRFREDPLTPTVQVFRATWIVEASEV